MADHNPQHGRRQHFHRGRRGPDRRGGERRSTPREHVSESGSREPSKEAGRESAVDVEQIMRDIRARIAQRHGIELNNQQIQELAARRLEAILEPRHAKPQLLEQLRRAAGAAPEIPGSAPIETYEFEDTTLYDTPRGLVRFFRKLLNPVLKLLFNPAPLVHALNTQVRINKELAARERERERRQSEWNALQYELMQRVVLETSRISIEMQAMSARVESLGAKVDFNDRRVRSLENAPAPAPSRQPQRPQEPALPAAAPADTSPSEAAASGDSGDGTRRRRRRRRGRRSGGPFGEAASATNPTAMVEDDVEAGDGDEEEAVEGSADTGRTEVAVLPPSPEPPSAPASTEASQPVEPAASPAVAPSPPRDEPTPQHPVDHAEPGPEER